MSKTFPGGVHPPEEKEHSRSKPIRKIPLPPTVTIPMIQHLGAPCKPLVKKGDRVMRGTMVGEAGGYVSAPVHASTSGKVAKVEPVDHPFGRRILSVIIEADGEDGWEEGADTPQDYSKLPPQEKKELIFKAGLVGMGGAAFPTHVKLSPPSHKPIDTFILNGVECEPYLTADHRLMLENPEEILKGMAIIMEILGVKRGIVGIENNKPDAIKIMEERASAFDGITVEGLRVKYPQGAEKQLIKALLGREVPSGGLPMDVGVVVHNVGTSFAVYEAVALRKPLIERVVTVAGDGITEPGNFLVRIGASIQVLLEEAGVRPAAARLVMGGPMMGLAQYSADTMVIKGTSGILVLMDDSLYEPHNCIRCGSCVRACPMQLIPSELSILCEGMNFVLAREKNLLDCIECGACTFVCPAKRPIVHQVKFGKAEVQRIMAEEKQKVEKEKAEGKKENEN